MKNNTLELLSPAKNLESGKTAINFGADAVYIGAPKFGARAVVGNSIQDIENLCKYAHKFHSKVFVALNTILYEKELAEAEKIIHQIYNSGADALIIQDIGILEMDLPPIPLHASTQAHNIDFRKINFYEKTGFTRAILARELSLHQIAEIRNNTHIELEAFIHGALCVSYSGQCYMSAYIGGRSGNRGECAQTCRLKYDLYDENNKLLAKNKHLLSLKDMNRSANIIDMINAGITSFKIEGRLKDQNYVKNVTAYYRKILDNFFNDNKEFKQSSIGRFFFDFEPDLEKTFNRRFTDYFLTERKPEMTSTSPKSVGKPLGRVKKSDKNFIEIDSKEKIINGDGLCFFDKNEELIGFSVNKTENNKIYTKNIAQISVGTLIFRNNDHDFNKKISQIENGRFIFVNILFSETNSGFSLKISTEEEVYSVEKTLELKKETANNEQKAVENIKNQLQKTGNTVFKVNKLNINLPNIYFVPISELNKIRREALDVLYTLLGSKYIISENKIEKNNAQFILKELDYKANISNSLAEKFYLNHGVEKTEQAFEISKKEDRKVVMTTKLCIKYNLGFCPTYQNPKEKINPKYLKLDNKTFILEFDCKNCEMKIITK
ncbi:MAG: U32 family peptidase [Bacteroidales bacterium]|nr:U32 family peptidase [Bacteroidales bacterium]